MDLLAIQDRNLFHKSKFSEVQAGMLIISPT